MNREEYRSGLWNKESKNGNQYATGKLKIGDKNYILTLFVNNNKKSEKSPDYNLIIKDIPVVEIKEKNNNVLDEKVFADFGNKIEIDDSELAF